LVFIDSNLFISCSFFLPIFTQSFLLFISSQLLFHSFRLPLFVFSPLLSHCLHDSLFYLTSSSHMYLQITSITPPFSFLSYQYIILTSYTSKSFLSLLFSTLFFIFYFSLLTYITLSLYYSISLLDALSLLSSTVFITECCYVILYIACLEYCTLHGVTKNSLHSGNVIHCKLFILYTACH
jgi:hypothetical protein